MVPRRPSGAGTPQDIAGRELLQAAQTPVRQPSVPQSSSPYVPGSTMSSANTGRTASTSATEDTWSSPTPDVFAEPRRPPRQSAFESQLSGLLQEFARIETGDYEACYAFARRNNSIWDCKEEDLLKDAYAALVASKESHAKRCIQRAVMIRKCSELSPSRIRTFFEGLINKNGSSLEDFLKNCNDATANIKAILPAAIAPSSERTAPQDPNSLSALDSMSLEGGYSRAPGEQRSLDQFPRSKARTHQDMSGPILPQSGYPRNKGEWRPATHLSGPTSRMHQDSPIQREPTAAAGRRGVTSDLPTVPDTDLRLTVNSLDARYEIRTSSAAFFIFGRVFATPWHTALGANQAAALRNSDLRDWVVKDCFGGSILTHIQRMVVVKEGHGFSWCVFINTYQGRGVAKPGLSQRDRLAHAIIYMSGSGAKQAAAEKDMMKKAPIAVTAADPDQKLDIMSRINFGKVHTIEHNVKVMDVGKISRDDMDDFRDYWNYHR